MTDVAITTSHQRRKTKIVPASIIDELILSTLEVQITCITYRISLVNGFVSY